MLKRADNENEKKTLDLHYVSAVQKKLGTKRIQLLKNLSV